MKTLKASDIMNLTEGLLYCAQHHKDFRCFDKCPYKRQDRNMFCQTDMKLNAAEKIAELMIIIQGLIAENEKLKNELAKRSEDEHKPLTFKDVFLDKFPQAKTYSDGYPLSCRVNIFDGECHGEMKCADCWNLPYSEPKEEGEE